MLLFAFILILSFIPLLRVYQLLIVDKISNQPAVAKQHLSPTESYFITKEIKVYSFIKKVKLKFFYALFCICLMLMLNISANVSIWHNIKGLSLEDKKNSIAFRNLRGSNCINEFTALKPVLDAAQNNSYTVSDIVSLLGKPDATLDNGNTLKYNLFPSTKGCSGVIECANGKVINCSIVNCD